MTARVAAVELRRSAAPWIGALAAALGWALAGDPERWDGLWMAAVLVHHGNLTLLWPVALAAGAWQGRRDRAAGMTELLRSTPRPAARRAAPLAAVVAACLAAGYGLGLLDGLARAVLHASYRPPGWYWPVLTGALGLAASGLLGLGLGRLLPSRLTAPLLAAGALAVLVAPQLAWPDSGARALLLIPGHLGGTDEYSTVDGRTVAGQALWFAALAAAGAALLAAGRRRLVAPLAVLLGAAAALPVLPPADRAAPRDPHAAELVCAEGTPRVCVTRLYEPLLPRLTGPARRALRVLARLPDPPTAVVQETARYGTPVAQRRDTVHLSLTVYADGTIATGSGSIEDDILEGAGTWKCGAADADTATWTRIDAARVAAGRWLRGAGTAPQELWVQDRDLVDRALATLRALPADAQLARVARLRDAALDCRPDLHEVLTGSA
ncbi:hypothetical protein Daura_18360 [Dactylosporangium aurantiacum]|uniref:Uncharacterized protein n=1 Tax=Dactylosporangium aurantiacum TaxID=35754 RepID=A0A9Q9IS21_9ACTN|nr:hypothetical protein [Dactylosporangium aurantiacum]MDG6105866.1 hypothetical protein [Dactylosporangium aurantiacum]UWZ57958.1 hypothetical protein Daura_18360 [Dactylosporangium aurantiacum]